MKITESINWNIRVADCETLAGMSLFSFYNPDDGGWDEFEISPYKNDLLKFISYYRRGAFDYGVYYNGIGFDCPVIEYVIRNYEKWVDLEGIEIVKLIYQNAQDVISDRQFGKSLSFREEHFTIPCIDVFEINGLSNAARMSSLKKIEFQLDWWSVEEMPIEHWRDNLSEEECEMVKSYCRNDIMATYELFKLTLGNTEHPIYKGNNQIDLRLSIQEEFDIPCLNYSDIKIGDELMKKNYAEAKGIDVWQLPKKGFFRKEIRLNNCIPSYVKFKTPQLKEILKDLKKKVIKQKDSHEVVFNYGKFNTEYTIGLGGGHSTNKNEIWKADENHLLIDLDVGSLYPAIICNEEYYPQHLGKELLKVYNKLYLKRIELKPLSKNDKKIKGICDGIKLLLNSAYGKMGSMDSWMYDKQVPYAVCLTGQMNLLMLIEEMELNGIYCFSFNTDGATFQVNTSLVDKFYEICKEWETKTNLILEEMRFKSLRYSTVNDYIGVKDDGKLKVKGAYISDYELWKNKSWKIVAMSLQEYFKNGTSPEDFIKGHRNIYDFCLMTRASGQLYLEMEGGGETRKLKKLVRYYLSSKSEWQLYKRGIGSTGKEANISLHASNDLGDVHIQYFNQYEEKPFEQYGVDVDQYIWKALKIIDALEKTNKVKNFLARKANINQLSLF